MLAHSLGGSQSKIKWACEFGIDEGRLWEDHRVSQEV